MSSTALGTFLGRAKNFRVDGNIARADLFLSKEAKEAPGGDLYNYVLGMAENEPDMFGMSIVFKPGKKYQRDEDGEKVFSGFDDSAPVYVEMGKLLAADFVDDPAANAGGLFNSDTIAGQVSEFLDTHPHVFELLQERPEIAELFFERYKGYLERKAEENKTDFDAQSIEKEVAAVAVSDNESLSVDNTNKEENPMEARELFAEMEEKFGSEIASEVFKSGGGMEEAEALAESKQFAEVIEERDAYEAENAELKAQVEELNAKLSAITSGEEEAIELDADEELEEDEKPVDCKAKIKEYQAQGLSAVDAQNQVAKEYPEEFKAQLM
jgi:hypothetical protein